MFGNNNRKGISAKAGDGLATFARRKAGYPPPCAHDAKAPCGKPHGWQKNGRECQRNLNDLVVRMRYPTPKANDANGPWPTTHYPSLNVVVRKYPTPTAQDGKNNAGPSQFNRHSASLNVIAAIYPTIGCKTMGGATGSFKKLQRLKEAGVISEDERRSMAFGNSGQLNPDWVEWLMAWPIGWTDLKTSNHRLFWLNPSIDPADFDDNPISRITSRRDQRPVRIMEIGNGQFPLTCVVAFDWGFQLLINLN